jgi:Homeodomain-like domain
MPKCTFVEMPPEEHRQILAALRRARYGYLLALHILVLCAAGRTPTDIAAVLFCSRSSVYRTVRAYRAKTFGLEHDDQGQLSPPVRTTVLLPTLRRSLVALLKATPPGLWLVSHALELRDAGRHPADQAGPHGLGRDHAALGPRGGLGVEARQAGR